MWKNCTLLLWNWWDFRTLICYGEFFVSKNHSILEALSSCLLNEYFKVVYFLFDRPFPNVSNVWKGVLNNGKTGFFNPAYTVAYLGSNLPSNKTEFIRGGMYK